MTYECTCTPIRFPGVPDKCVGCLFNEAEHLREASTYAIDMLGLLARLHEAESLRLGEQWSPDAWLWGAACMESRAHGAFAVQLAALSSSLTMRFRPDLLASEETGASPEIDAGDRGFLLHKSRQVCEAMLTNMHAARSLPYALGEQVAERSGVFVVVGAGPSLEQTGPELARLQAEGAVICTVNAALGAVSRYVVPDVVLTREIVDVSEHLRFPAKLRVMDIGASTKAWDVAREMGPTAWFVPGASQTFKLAQSYAVRPLFGGTAAATAMVALAAEWGAAEIVLVAMDFSTSAAKGSPWEGYTVADDGSVSGAGYEVKKAAHASAGIAPPQAKVESFMAHGWGGGPPVRTLASFVDQVQWLETFASRHPEIRCVDATGAGVAKRGWIEMPASDSRILYERTAEWRLTDCLPLTAAQHDAAREHVLAQSRTAQVVAGNVLHAEGVPVAVPRFERGYDVVDAMAAGDMLRAVEAAGSREAKIRAFHEAVASAAERVREMLGSSR